MVPSARRGNCCPHCFVVNLTTCGSLLDGLPHVVADAVTREKAEEYLALLRRAGVASRVVRADEH